MTLAWRISVAVLLLGCGLAFTSSAAVLIKDINQREAPVSSFPGFLGVAGQWTLLAAESTSTGRELWRTDGTAAGTTLLRDFSDIPSGGSPQFPIQFPGRVVFIALDGSVPALWTSDGTSAGTQMLASLGNQINYAYLGKAGAGVALFVARDFNGRAHLWRTDGTPEGTQDIATAPYIEAIGVRPVEVVGRVYYRVGSNAREFALWSSDGTGPGTRLEKEVPADFPYTHPHSAVVLDGNIAFVAATGGTREQVWLFDTASSSLMQLSSFPAVPPDYWGPAEPSQLVAANGVVFFSAYRQPWRTNGTTAGTFSLRDDDESTHMTLFGGLMVTASAAYFTADVPGIGVEPWMSDGTVSGTVLLGDMAPGEAGSNTSFVGAAGDRAYFTVPAAGGAPHLWASEGSLATTRDTGFTGGLAAVADTRLFLTRPAGGGMDELWVSALDVSGASRLGGAFYDSGLPNDTLVVGDGLFYTDGTPLGNLEPGYSNGTAATTFRLRDIAVASATDASQPQEFVSFGDTALFVAAHDAYGGELWRTDGTTAGTALVRDIRPGEGGSRLQSLVLSGGAAYFTADDGNGRALWRSDGTEAGTVRITELFPETFCETTWILDAGSYSYFAVQPQIGSLVELWRTDGTSAGTQLVADSGTGTSLQSLCPLGAIGSNFYFSGIDAAHGSELWKSDGTAAGTVLVADINPGPGYGVNGVFPSHMGVNIGNEIVFLATAGGVARGIWKSDGTAAGTREILSLKNGEFVSWIAAIGNTAVVGVAMSGLQGLHRWTAGSSGTMDRYATNIIPSDSVVRMGAHLYFPAMTVNATGQPTGGPAQLWRTDATPGGTAAATNLAPPSPVDGTYYDHLMSSADTVVFEVTQGGSGSKPAVGLWATGGTPETTRRLSDESLQDQGVDRPIALAGKLPVFTARFPGSGVSTELYGVAMIAPIAIDDAARARSGETTVVGAADNDRALLSALAPSTVRIITNPANGTATASSSGAISYRANAAFVGSDTITYAVRDNLGMESNIAHIVITVEAPPTTPPPAPAPGGGGGGGAVDLGILCLLFGALISSLCTCGCCRAPSPRDTSAH